MAYSERLLGEAAVKGTMLLAHLEWAKGKNADVVDRIRKELDEDGAKLLARGVLSTDWIPLAFLVEVDRKIAQLSGGNPEDVFRELGRNSAQENLGGVYKAFVATDPHRFFGRMKLLHGRFCNFGLPHYEQLSERTGRIQIEECDEYSPVYCASTLGYYEGALEAMKVEGPIKVQEKTCQCRGKSICSYELSW